MYCVQAADELGGGHEAVCASLRGALTSLLSDFPSLPHETLSDESGAASNDCLRWLDASGFLGMEDEESSSEGVEDDTDPEKAAREVSIERARQMVRAGDATAAIRLLSRRVDHEKSGRAKFLLDGEVASIMVERSEFRVARPKLEGLLQKIKDHNLEEWEAEDVVARILGLYFWCLEPDDDQGRDEILDRISALDENLARSIWEKVDER
jgi:hypothetical protein